MEPISLTNIKMIAVDLETKDPNLMSKGPGVYRKDGYILGVAMGFHYEDGTIKTCYVNVGHYDCKEEEKKAKWKYIQTVLSLPHPKVFANALYDLDWLINFQGIEVNGKWHDVQVAEPIIDEHQWSYKLEVLGKKYLNYGKADTKLENFCKENGLVVNKTNAVQSYLWKMPGWLVEEYACMDVELPLKIIEKQFKQLEAEGLAEVYRLEIGLLPLLLQMRKEGVRIDVDYVDEMTSFMYEEMLNTQAEIENEVGDINYRSSKQMAALFDRLSLAYDLTEKGNPSITKERLISAADELAEGNVIQKIVNNRQTEKTVKDFFVTSFSDFRINGRIHTSFFPLRSDRGGTVSGRFSSAQPNLQQIPARHPVLGPRSRRAFIPNSDCLWGKLDWSQIEYRIIAHYAIGKGSNEIREKYSNDARTDYHQVVMDWTGLSRKPAKNLNFGCAYAMGYKTCAEKFGWTKDYAKEVVNLYHQKVPFVRETLQAVGDVGLRRGYVKTKLNRRARLVNKDKSYVMFNRVIQGTAADIMKKSMLDAYNKGIFNILAPHLTVHDELDVSIPRTKEGQEAIWELKNVMENCITLKVPIISDLEIGTNWADVKLMENKKQIEETLNG